MATFQSSLSPFGSAVPLNVNIIARFDIEQHRIIHIEFSLSGNLETVFIDTPSISPARKDDLWKTTCFEIFLRGDTGNIYWEYNLSPSLNWAAYAFSGYREGRIDEPSVKHIEISTQSKPDRFTLTCTIPLPPPLFDQNLRIGLSTVVQDNHGNIYYYALKQTGQHPDFHADENFSIRVTNP